MLCPGCNQWMDDQAQFCGSCGSPLPAAGAGAVPQATPAEPATMGYASGAGAVVYAGFWRRFAAAFIDGIIVNTGTFIIGVVIGLIYGMLSRSTEGAEYIGAIQGLICGWLYFTLFESSTLQATPGKLAIGIVVTDMYGRRVSFGRATGRYFGKIISGLILGIGFIMAGFTAKKQALHDSMADCLVVCKQRAGDGYAR